MKKLKITFLLIVCGLAASYVGNSQKLPAIQQISLRAPANVKVDGKAIEWNNRFQAYNNHTEFYYTMANDDENLYLIVQSATGNYKQDNQRRYNSGYYYQRQKG